MCLKTFKEKSKNDFNSWDEWVSFVNMNEHYGRTKSKTFDFRGICEPEFLPSFHPYWKPARKCEYIIFFEKNIVEDVVPGKLEFTLCKFRRKYNKQVYKLIKDIDNNSFKIERTPYATLCKYLGMKYGDKKNKLSI